MTYDVTFIGDPITAAGFRLAGVRCFAPASERLVERVAAERDRCKVLAITTEVFAQLPAKLARDLREARTPLLTLVPSAQRPGDAADMQGMVHRALGIEV